MREMRRAQQALSEEECLVLLDAATSGVLAVTGDEGYPYAVPLSFARAGRTLYFHCAFVGHKLDAIRRDGRASFCVIARDDVAPEDYTTDYRSVIAFGRARVAEDIDEKRAALTALLVKYAPSREGERAEKVESSLAHTCVLALEMERLTGKEGRRLATARRQ